MKKVFILLIGIIALAGCGSETNELEKFADDFNDAAETREVPKLDSEKFGEIEIEDDRGWQLLYDSDEYTIDAKYEDGENLSGYYLVINEKDPAELQTSEGYWSGVTIARALGLDSKAFIDELGTALTTGSHSYTDSGYRVSFTNPGEDGLTSVGLIINFDKK